MVKVQKQEGTKDRGLFAVAKIPPLLMTKTVAKSLMTKASSGHT